MENGKTVRLEIPWQTIVKVLAGVLLAFVAVKLWPFFKLLIVSLLLAIPLYRLVVWTGRKGLPQWAGQLIASLGLVVLVLGFAALVGPLAYRQAANFAKDFPKFKQQIVAHLPVDGPIRNAVDNAGNVGSNELQQAAKKGLAAAATTVSGLLDVVLVIALAIYLIADGQRAVRWFVAFFPRERRPRIQKGLDKIGDRVVAYVVGQAMVSGLVGIFSCIVLSLLHVPAALLVALIAAVLDVIPIIGISITLVLAGLLGLTVSPATALIVVALYSGYHLLEDYFIVPKVYGRKLKISTLAVLLSMLAGGILAGVVGAIAALPLTAAYPALEALWLRRHLEPEVVEDHQEQLRAA